jgi:hypothetical protein
MCKMDKYRENSKYEKVVHKGKCTYYAKNLEY